MTYVENIRMHYIYEIYKQINGKKNGKKKQSIMMEKNFVLSTKALNKTED